MYMTLIVSILRLCIHLHLLFFEIVKNIVEIVGPIIMDYTVAIQLLWKCRRTRRCCYSDDVCYR